METPRSYEAADLKVMDNSKDHVEVSEELTWTPEEEKKLVRKIDLYLLPTIWLMYLLSYMDRTKYVSSFQVYRATADPSSTVLAMQRLPAWPTILS
jgi:hypothetical protein